MKILILTPRIPYPPFRGDKLKVYNIAKNLARKNEVSILTFITHNEELEYVKELEKIGLKVDTVLLPKFASFLNLVRSIFNLNPLQVSYFYSGKMRKKIQALTSETHFDAVYTHLLVLMQYLKDIKGDKTLKVVDFTDSISMYLSRYVKMLKNPIMKLAFYYELYAVKFYEKNAKKYDTLFLCSSADIKNLEDRDIHHNIQILPNGVDLDTFKPEDVAVEKNRIMFSGNMPYYPNSDAVFYFTKEIFPLILKENQEAKFYIVGQNPSEKIKSLQRDNIVVTGYVNDIRSEYLKSAVNVAPIRFGAGTLNKIIESLLLGVPTIATSISIAGFPAELKKYIITADSSEEFARKVVDVLNNPAAYKEMMAEASAKVKEILNWEKIVDDFESYISSRIDK